MNTFTGLFQNVNDDRNIPVHLPEYSLSKRLDNILLGCDQDFIALSEITIKHLYMVLEKLAALGYRCSHMAYSPNQFPDMSFYHVLAWKNSIELIDITQYWFTDTPTTELTPETRKADPVLVKYAEQFEKGTLIGVFKAGSGVIIVSVNHFGLKRFGTDLQYTNECARMLASVFDDYSLIYPNATIVAGADFNAFDDSDHVDELLMSTDLNDVTPPEKSFCNYPWDLGLMRPETRDRILAAREDMKLLTGREYIDRAVACLQDLYGGPLCSKIDRILSNRDIAVRTTIDMSVITLANYSEVPFAPSDHTGYVVTINI